MPTDPRYMAAAAALQLYGNIDPDRSRTLARRVVDAALRAGVRPTDGLPTEAEVARAQAALARRQFQVARDDAYAALLAALCPGLVE
jgi:hypothetical protein